MGFYSSLTYYRPTNPPVVTTPQLADFIERVRDTGLTQSSGFMDVSLKYGPRISKNFAETFWAVPIISGLFSIREIEWDFKSRFSSFDEIIKALRQTDQPIYRGRISLGLVVDDVCHQIYRLNSPENTDDFTPGELGFELGPITNGLMNDDDYIHVGWMSLNLHGYGYLYPWTPQDAIRRVLAVDKIQRLMQVAREMFPVSPSDVGRREKSARKRLGRAWPYPTMDVPYDWCWGINGG